jgi:uncharacterized protein involved in response to NO
MALVAGWGVARGLAFTPWPLAAGLVSAAFPLAAAAALAVPFIAARNRRNYFFVALLVGLAAADTVFTLSVTGHIALAPQWALRIGLDLMLFIVAVMAGRVVPMFTNNAVPGARASRHPRLEQAVLGSLLALVAVDLVPQASAALPATLLVFAAVAHAARWWRWQPWQTRGTPILWVLHLAYAWVPLHLLLRAAAAFDWVPPSTATHALTTGVIGGLVIGMVTRTARGHTGRPLRADRADVAAYALVAAAALARVLGPWLAPVAAPQWIVAAALLWSAGFGLYAVHYWPVLSRPRLDGRPG